MFPEQRYALIQKLAEESGFVSLDELRRHAECSDATIRRDIARLAEIGAIRKATGGILPSSAPAEDDTQTPYTERLTVNHDAKRRVGIAAQQLIDDGDILFIHGGTTCLEVATHIGKDKELTVITDHLGIVSALRRNPHVELFLLGGKVKNTQQLLTGPMVTRMLETFNPNKTIMGGGGISLAKGVTNFDYFGADIEQRIVELANNLIFVLDHTKFAKDVLCQIAPIETIDAIVTNAELDDAIASEFEGAGINIVRG